MSADYKDFINGDILNVRRITAGYFRQNVGIIDNFPIPATGPSAMYLKATAARDILLPIVTADIDGKLLFIYNEGTGVITVKTNSDAALVPARTIAGNAAMILQAVQGLAATAAWKVLSVT